MVHRLRHRRAGTHIKANANKKKKQKIEVEAPAKKYQEQLDAEIEADRAAHEKKPLKPKDDDDTLPPTKTITESTTDPECGLFHKGEHEKQFAYASNTACDRNGFVLDFEVSPANLHDSVTFDDLYKRLARKYPKTDAIAVDAGYKIPYIMKLILESGKIPCVPYKRPQTKDGFFKKYELDKATAHMKEQLAITYGEIVYTVSGLPPLHKALDAFVDSTQENVCGKVKLKLYKGNMINAGVSSKFSLYSEDIATFGESDYNQTDSEGFINLFGLPIKVQAMMVQGLLK